MEQFKYSLSIKTLCYILVPILLVMLLASLCSIFYVAEEPDILQTINFDETQRFERMYKSRLSSLYYNQIQRNTEYDIAEEDISDYVLANENKEEEVNIVVHYENQETYFEGCLKYIIETKDNVVYTNIASLTAENMEQKKAETEQQEVYWIKTENGITTNLAQEENGSSYYSLEKENNRVYSYLTKEYKNTNAYGMENLLYQIAKEAYHGLPFYLPVSIIGMVMIAVYLIASVGHKKGKEEIYLSSFDKIPIEIASAIIGILYTISVYFAIATVQLIENNVQQLINLIILGMIPLYMVTILTFVTATRRIKSHTFLRNSICYRVLKKMIEFVKNIKLTLRTAIFYFLFGFITTILIIERDNGWNVLWLIGMWIACGIYILNRVTEYYKIRDFIQNLYEGNDVEPLKEEDFKGEFKKLIPKLNDVASGFSNAIEKGIQSERLKTELITNVSHDIKTPLTSIINYVDLMKKEEIENEKVKEYLEVLDKKSQRLKKLTEDLVEASKASSGNIKLNKEDLNMKELIIQEIGEFDERFKEKGLQIIETFPEENMILNADGKYMSRILDNIFSNISKYALLNSRVYIDAKVESSGMEISFKNISANQLNITADELMERFVRGDVARTTEGSGLGLSIAKSLTELQGGSFIIYLDGDLFKVVIKF